MCYLLAYRKGRPSHPHHHVLCNLRSWILLSWVNRHLMRKRSLKKSTLVTVVILSLSLFLPPPLSESDCSSVALVVGVVTVGILAGVGERAAINKKNQ